MEAIIERTSRRVTVSMSTRRWNRIQKLEQAYKLASTIKRSMKQAETAPAMTVLRLTCKTYQITSSIRSLKM